MAGDNPNEAALDAARIAATHEEGIAIEAAAIRGDATQLTAELFGRLWPLLCRPIPAAYIQTIEAVKGKPYESTGIKSVQVQIDRMNNVLTPLWWWDAVAYEEGGKLAQVVVFVGNRNVLSSVVDGRTHYDDEVFVARSSHGGVNQGSSIGNIYKGSYTNAAKRAFAMLGPGHEVYLGTSDLDPDVDADVAAAQAGGTEPSVIGKAHAKKLVDRAWQIPDAKRQLQLAASHVTEKEIADCSTKAKAATALEGLTFAQAERLDNWITQKGGGDA